jgi:hypothetical protein
VRNIDYLLFTTCDMKGDRLDDLVRLLTSIQREIRQGALNVRHYVLLQRATAIPEELQSFVSDTHVFMCMDQRLSLARARNLMINRSRREGVLQRAEICAFPDDDAWYPERVLKSFRELFGSDDDIGMITCKYGSSPRSESEPERLFATFARSPGCGTFIRQVCSITLFLRAELLESAGYFDERLGIGAAINGGEDIDFALRAYCSSTRKVLLSDEKYIGHRDKLPSVRSKYFAGDLFAIARSAGQSGCVLVQLARKLCVGVYLVLTRQMSFAEFSSGLEVGLKGLGAKEIHVEPFL